jgi:hypothetical protein
MQHFCTPPYKNLAGILLTRWQSLNVVEITDWLAAVRQCPDERVKEPDGTRLISRLTADFGLYDNWSVVLKADFATVARDFLTSPNEFVTGSYIAQENKPTREELVQQLDTIRHFELDYAPGEIIITFRDWVGGLWEQYGEDYDVMIMLHPYQTRKIPGKTGHRVLAEVNEDVCHYAMKRRFPFCLPDSSGWYFPDDASRTVKWSPK